MILDDLAEMHLLLREFGWEPEVETGNGPAYWVWSLPGREGFNVYTWPLPDSFGREWPGTIWTEGYPSQRWEPYGPPPKRYFTVAGLQRRLKELATASRSVRKRSNS